MHVEGGARQTQHRYNIGTTNRSYSTCLQYSFKCRDCVARSEKIENMQEKWDITESHKRNVVLTLVQQ